MILYIQYAKLEFDTFCIIAHEDIVSSANDLREFIYFFNSGLGKILKDKYNFPVEHIFPKNSKNLYLLGSSFSTITNTMKENALLLIWH